MPPALPNEPPLQVGRGFSALFPSQGSPARSLITLHQTPTNLACPSCAVQIRARVMSRIPLCPDRLVAGGTTTLDEILYGGGQHEVRQG